MSALALRRGNSTNVTRKLERAVVKRIRDVDFSSGQIRIEQACYRGLLGSSKTEGSSRTPPLPTGLVKPLMRTCEKGIPLNDTNVLHRHLKPVGE